jgi:hypothetical protein
VEQLQLAMRLRAARQQTLQVAANSSNRWVRGQLVPRREMPLMFRMPQGRRVEKAAAALLLPLQQLLPLQARGRHALLIVQQDHPQPQLVMMAAQEQVMQQGTTIWTWRLFWQRFRLTCGKTCCSPRTRRRWQPCRLPFVRRRACCELATAPTRSSRRTCCLPPQWVGWQPCLAAAAVREEVEQQAVVLLASLQPLEATL